MSRLLRVEKQVLPNGEQGKKRGRSRLLNPLRGGSGECICEETLELYVLGRLPGQQGRNADHPEVEAVEIHLLTCVSCQERAGVLEIETRELRKILRQLEATAKPKTFSAGS
jgi:hypothetical protein